MDEPVTVILGAILGATVWLTTRGKLRFLSDAAVIVSGATMIIARGESHQSRVSAAGFRRGRAWARRRLRSRGAAVDDALGRPRGATRG